MKAILAVVAKRRRSLLPHFFFQFPTLTQILGTCGHSIYMLLGVISSLQQSRIKIRVLFHASGISKITSERDKNDYGKFQCWNSKASCYFLCKWFEHYKLKTSLIPTSTPFTRYSSLHFDKESLLLGYLIVECCLCTKTKQTFEDVTPD